MAYMEFNALSVILCGSFSAKVFLPEMPQMELKHPGRGKKYPVLWLYHSEGGTALDWVKTSAERCAVRHGIIIIAPDAQHSLCTNMDYGPQYEQFAAEELPGIFRHVLPISTDPSANWIGGTGTGAYGALKLALKNPGVFSRAIALNGIFDMTRIIRLALEGRDTGIFHNQASLKAVFGDLDAYEDSEHDLYMLAAQARQGQYFLSCNEHCPYREETEAVAALLGDRAQLNLEQQDEPDGPDWHALMSAVAWLTGKTVAAKDAGESIEAKEAIEANESIKSIEKEES